MYCKYCGKEIADDSKFCKCCGKLVVESCADDMQSSATSSINQNQEATNTGVEDNAMMKIEIVPNRAIKKSTVANEVVANLKMIGIALVLVFVYILAFVVIHQKDIKPLDENSYWGESCYDPKTISDSRIFDWQGNFAVEVEMSPDYTKPTDNPFDIMRFIPLSSATYSLILSMGPKEAIDYANRVAKEKGIDKENLKRLENVAKEKAQQNRNDFNEEITEIRKQRYEENLHNNMLWAVVISLSLTIFGRYLIVFGKWVANNKKDSR